MTPTTPEVRMHAPVGRTVAFAIVVSVCGGAAFGGALAGLVGDFASGFRSPSLIVGLSVGLASALALIIGYLVSWRRAGGVERVAAVSASIRAGVFPRGLRSEDVTTALERRLARGAKWPQALFPGFVWLLLGVAHLLRPTGPGDLLYGISMSAFWVVTMLWALLFRFRTRPHIERLLAEARARLAVEWPPPEG